jgi:hypothetical protein
MLNIGDAATNKGALDQRPLQATGGYDPAIATTVEWVISIGVASAEEVIIWMVTAMGHIFHEIVSDLNLPKWMRPDWLLIEQSDKPNRQRNNNQQRQQPITHQQGQPLGQPVYPQYEEEYMPVNGRNQQWQQSGVRRVRR